MNKQRNPAPQRQTTLKTPLNQFHVKIESTCAHYKKLYFKKLLFRLHLISLHPFYTMFTNIPFFQKTSTFKN